MNILILNWRDIKNPQSGGAEILTHEIAKRLVSQNHSVIQFSSKFKNSKTQETIDGVKIIRDGHPDLRMGLKSVHYKAFQRYQLKKFGKIDLVIDEIHGVPFFTPFYVKEKKIAFICEYAGDLWDKAVRFPFNLFGRLVEKLYPFFYRNSTVVTISESSRKELKEHLFYKKPISVIKPGCTTKTLTKISSKKASKSLQLVFIARLTVSKGIEDAIFTIYLLKKSIPEVKLHIVGRGTDEYTEHVKELINKYEVSRNIILHGYISEEEKIKIIDKSHFIIVPSQKEGWGLTIHEANARGVPAIGYDIPGLRDVIKKNVNGILTKDKTPESIASEILTIFNNKKLYNRISKASISERKKYDWDATVKEFLEILA